MARRPVGKLDPGMFDRLRLGWRLLRDPRVPAWPKWIVPVVAAIYVVSPIDAIPDVVPVAGFADDAVVLGFVLNLVRGEVDEFMKWEARPGQ